MQSQSYANHVHRPLPTLVTFVLLLLALGAFGLRWFGLGGRATFAAGLMALVFAVGVLLYTSRIYTTKLQDRIIRLEMRVRGASVLTPAQQQILAQLPMKQVVALRFACDAELPALLERTAREKMAPADIKRAITAWNPDHHRT
jgi:uncharacterized membrane protein YbjE (DUF340 family)